MRDNAELVLLGDPGILYIFGPFLGLMMNLKTSSISLLLLACLASSCWLGRLLYAEMLLWLVNAFAQ